MAWRWPGDKPLSEPMMVELRIYAPLGLNEIIESMNKICENVADNLISLSSRIQLFVCNLLGKDDVVEIIIYSTLCSGVDQRKHQSSASLAFVMGIHRWPVNSPNKGPVTRNMFPFDDVIKTRDLREIKGISRNNVILLIHD